MIHAAADVSAARGHSDINRSDLLAATFDGTRRALDFAVSRDTRRFLMVSSGAVYGSQPSALAHIPESYSGAPDPCLLESAYSEGKRASEALCAAYSSRAGLACTIARPFCFCRTPSGARPGLCHWRLHSQRPCLRTHPHSRRRNGNALLPLRRRFGSLAVDDPGSRHASFSLQCGFRSGDQHSCVGRGGSHPYCRPASPPE